MRRLLARLVFLGLVAGALLWWSQSRQPRDLGLQIDLTGVEPGGISRVDVVVRRSGHALGRHEVQYGDGGAPGTVEMIVHAPPGEAEVETTLVSSGASRRSMARVTLSADAPARIRPEFRGQPTH
jgi:hypothetical protein